MENKLRQQYLRATAVLNTLSLLQRSGVFVAGFLFLSLVFYVLFWQPLQNKQNVLRIKRSQVQTHITQLEKQAQIILLDAERQQKSQQKHRALRQEKIRLKEKLKHVVSDLITPDQLSSMLKSLVAASPRLVLEEMQSLPPKAFVTVKKNGVTQQLYQHPVRLKLRGSYTQIVSYLEKIEGLPWRIVWDELTYDVIDYPEARVTLKLHTVSATLKD